MNFAFSEDQLAIKDSVAKLCAQFDDKYWLKKDKEGGFPEDFYRTMADAGWLGIAMPEEYGGSGARHHRGGAPDADRGRVGCRAAGRLGRPSQHLRAQPIVVFGTEEQKKRICPTSSRARSRAASPSPNPMPG